MSVSQTGGPCWMHSAPRAYIAAPLFTPEQRASIDAVVEVLHTVGFVSYSPYRDGVTLAPSDPPEKRDEVFYSNKLAIRQSDLLVAILDVKDTGTIWELGMSAALDIPTIAITLELEQMNVMLERGVVAHVTSLDHLEFALQTMRPYLVYGRKSTNDLRAAEAAVGQWMKKNYRYTGKTT